MLRRISDNRVFIGLEIGLGIVIFLGVTYLLVSLIKEPVWTVAKSGERCYIIKDFNVQAIVDCNTIQAR